MEWISLKKESPPSGDWILGLTDGGGIYQIRRINTKDDFTGKKHTDWMLPYYVRESAVFTHWMPMPEMPDEVERH